MAIAPLVVPLTITVVIAFLAISVTVTSIAGAEETRWQVAAALHIPLLTQAAESDRGTIVKLITVTGSFDEIATGRIDEHFATGTVDH